MAKRRLTQQQLRRINNKQRDNSMSTSAVDFSEQQPGLIIAHHGQQLIVENDKRQIFRCFARSNLPALATGDRVLWRASKKDHALGIIEKLQPRRSLIERPHVHRGLKPIAANIDILAIVIAPIPEPHPNLIDRYLIAATHAQLKPIIIVNKVDLIDDLDHYLSLFSMYPPLGYPVLTVSAIQQRGIDELNQHLKDNTSIFVGQSGVGKSSLLNQLLPDAATKVGALSTAHDSGKHTTTAAHLYHLNQGGDIIDSPGIREFGLWHLSHNDVINGFIEFERFAAHCKFRDCNHRDDTHCAIHRAVENDDIHPQRLANYLAILNSINDH